MPLQVPLHGSQERSVAIIGAGVAGLVSAVLLAARGVRVTLLERASRPGGKMREVTAGLRAMDAGPTVFTMRPVFEEIFAAAGRRLEDCLTLDRAEMLARHTWPDGSRLDLFTDSRRNVEEIGAFAGREEAERYRLFAARARRLHDWLEAPFLKAQRTNPLVMGLRVGPLGGLGLLADGAVLPMWRALGGAFRDPRLRQLYARYATYCGASPFAAPALLMLVAHVEETGVWLVRGGMHRLPVALESLARDLGVCIRYDAHVAEVNVRQGRAAGVSLASGERVAADAVISAGDVSALGTGLLGEKAQAAARAAPASERSLSALTFNLTTPTAGFPLDRHNVFFSSDYAAEFRQIFSERRLPAEPTVYICAQDRGGPEPWLSGAPERLLVLVNAPADGDTRAFDEREIDACREATLRLLARAGLRLDISPAETVTTRPADFAALFPGTGGAIYGRALHGFLGAFRRPGSRSRLPGLYLAGGSVHPGPGVPMAALSGMRASESILSDFASTRRFVPAAISGGMSTASATTAATPSR